MYNIIFLSILSLFISFAATAKPVVYLNSYAEGPSPLRMMDFLNERLAVTERELVNFKNFAAVVFPELEQKELKCHLQNRFDDTHGQLAYQKHLLERTSCLQYWLKEIKEVIHTSDLSRVIEKRKILIPHLQSKEFLFRRGVNQIQYQLKTVFDMDNLVGYNFNFDSRLVLIPVIADSNYTTIIRGRVNKLPKSWVAILHENPDKVSLHLNWFNMEVKNIPKVFWNGPTFEIRIPLEDIMPKQFEYVFEKGKLEKRYELPLKSKLSVGFCKGLALGLFPNDCLSSNDANVYFPITRGIANIEPSDDNN